jgi:hypothetical protein
MFGLKRVLRYIQCPFCPGWWPWDIGKSYMQERGKYFCSKCKQYFNAIDLTKSEQLLQQERKKLLLWNLQIPETQFPPKKEMKWL